MTINGDGACDPLLAMDPSPNPFPGRGPVFFVGIRTCGANLYNPQKTRLFILPNPSSSCPIVVQTTTHPIHPQNLAVSGFKTRALSCLIGVQTINLVYCLLMNYNLVFLVFIDSFVILSGNFGMICLSSTSSSISKSGYFPL